MKKLPFALFALSLSLAGNGRADSEVTPERLQEAIGKLDSLASETLARTKTPGMAIVVVHEDKPIFMKGFGVRAAGKSELIDEDTVFQIASLSKPITSTILARLVGEGVIGWDSVISDLDPGFRLQEPWVTSQVTIRDFLSHRSGLPEYAGDLLEDIGYDRAEVLHRLRFLKPGSSMRTHYAYSNFGYTEGAEAVAKKLGIPWEKLAAEKLYQPLGMTSTSSRFEDYENAPNRATIHTRVGEEWVAKFVRQPDAQAPAGGVSSTIRDLAQWMRLQLAAGKFDGKELIKADALAETHVPQIVNGVNPQTNRASFYGLGWNVNYDDHGRIMWNHSGAFFLGVRTQVAFYPAANLGIAVLANSGPNGIPEGVTMTFWDELFYGKPTRDWVEFANGMFDEEVKKMTGEVADYSHPPAKGSPSLALPAYVGKYSNEYFGGVEIAEQDGKLVLKLGPKQQAFFLRHFDRDLFVYQPPGENAPGPSGVAFEIGSKATAVALTIENFKATGHGRFLRSK